MFSQERLKKPAPVVTDNSSSKDEKAPVTATVKEDKERLLLQPGTKAAAFLFLAAITSILSLLIFQKNFKD